MQFVVSCADTFSIHRLPMENADEFYERNYNRTMKPVYHEDISAVGFKKKTFDFDLKSGKVCDQELDLCGLGIVKFFNASPLEAHCLFDVYMHRNARPVLRQALYLISGMGKISSIRTRNAQVNK